LRNGVPVASLLGDPTERIMVTSFAWMADHSPAIVLFQQFFLRKVQWHD
jgi:hypothetical protein